ncbi:MAG: glycoside hydrolase family 31 [Ferruginibacter sp.]|nr:glycoside hydrolase family 31 [Ferruginibacter sp.]
MQTLLTHQKGLFYQPYFIPYFSKSYNMKSIFTILSLATLLSAAAQNPVREAGNIKSVRTANNKISITTDNAFADIIIYSPNIIRVRMDKKQLIKDHSYAVITEPVKTNAKISETGSEISIVTDSMKAIIQKKPFAVAFYTLDGRLINEDEKGLNTSWVGDEVTNYRHMQADEKFIGLGEKTGDLNRRGNGYTNWNTDAFGYSAGQDPIYSTIPFYIGIHHDMNYGIFLDNTFQSDFNFGASNDRFSSFGAKNGEMNYYFIWHTKMADIIRSYTDLTGRMKLPPMWSLGYQQNRYSYYPDTEVLRIAQTLREKKIPADGITLDIHYMDRYQLFTWNKERFPNPLKLTNQLKDMGFKTTVIVDPGIKIEPGSGAYERGLQQDAYIKYSDGKYYTGQVWPGWCYFADFTSEKGRNFWRKEVKFFADNGISGTWNDMNEIATWGQKIPSNVIFDFEGRKGTHLEAHNVYGSLMAKTSYEGARAANPNERPFVLTRAGYAGLQNYTAIWTGDNRSEDNHMIAGVRLLNSLGLSGVPFTGMDIGGFTGNPSTGLYARWIQLGAFIPYFRNHTAINTKSSEPWAYGEEVTEISRNYISLRYKLMPYLYGSFYEATQNGLPVVRSLAIDNTFDNNIYNNAFQNQFMFGPSIMVAPVESGKDFTKVYFPKGGWYNFYSDEKEMGGQAKPVELSLQKLPVYVKESSIIPMQSLVQSTAIAPTDTLIVHLYKGTVNNSYVYYEDDGKSFDYEKGNFYKRLMNYDAANNIFRLEKAEGKSGSKFNYVSLVLHGFDNLNNLKVNAAGMTVKQGRTYLLSPISQFDPQGSEKAADGSATGNVVFKNNADAITVELN